MAVLLDTKRNGRIAERESKLAAAEPRGETNRRVFEDIEPIFNRFSKNRGRLYNAGRLGWLSCFP